MGLKMPLTQAAADASNMKNLGRTVNTEPIQQLSWKIVWIRLDKTVLIPNTETTLLNVGFSNEM